MTERHSEHAGAQPDTSPETDYNQSTPDPGSDSNSMFSR